MISKKTYKFCSEDIILIENAELAINDKNEIWHCHHRLETHDENGKPREKHISSLELIKNDLYFNRPANELILLPQREHMRLHNTGKNNNMYGVHLKRQYGREVSAETRQKISTANKGKVRTQEFKDRIRLINLGRKHTSLTKEKISEAKKGIKHHMYGKHHSEESKRKIAMYGKGRHWFTNGEFVVFTYVCPIGYRRGRK